MDMRKLLRPQEKTMMESKTDRKFDDKNISGSQYAKKQIMNFTKNSW